MDTTGHEPAGLRKVCVLEDLLFVSLKFPVFLVENTGLEPATSCMPCKRSPN